MSDSSESHIHLCSDECLPAGPSGNHGSAAACCSLLLNCRLSTRWGAAELLPWEQHLHNEREQAAHSRGACFWLSSKKEEKKKKGEQGKKERKEITV